MNSNHSNTTGFSRKDHDVDFCVIGGGLAGMCAAIAAARRGAKTILMNDRPVFGGNASSEIRMWVCGALGDNKRETGIIEEIQLENLYRNPGKAYSIWDSVLYEKVRYQDNLTSLQNCSCFDAEMNGNRIVSVTGWQTTTQTYHRIRAKVFADCSGDSVLAPLTGAECRIGREARSEFNESIEPETADEKVMGMSCLIQARETSSPKSFIPPSWAYRYEEEDLPFRDHDPHETNFWWLETGGLQDTIHDTEEIRDELLKIGFGVWDHIKNRCSKYDAANWELDWMGFIPGKRESRRYVGDYIVNQNDVSAGGRFEDIVAYAGWSMDDHHPAGIKYEGEPTIFHPAPSPWGIPYRSLYSKNIENLMFAGRNISVTHIALSSSRVMRTCAVIGQAAGTAAALAVGHDISPREVGRKRLDELQQALMDDDCWLPGRRRAVSKLTAEAAISASNGNAELLRSGHDRIIENDPNCWETSLGGHAEYRFERPVTVASVRIAFDSNLARYYRDMRQLYAHTLDFKPCPVAPELVRSFRIEYETEEGKWETLAREANNYQRLYRAAVTPTASRAFRLVPEKSWGNDTVRIFGWDIS